MVTNAFDRARRRLFDDRNVAQDASYTAPGGAPVACRVMTKHGDRPVQFGDSHPIGQSMTVEVLAADLTPSRNGVFTIGGTNYSIAGDPIREDADRAVWSCTVR